MEDEKCPCATLKAVKETTDRHEVEISFLRNGRDIDGRALASIEAKLNILIWGMGAIGVAVIGVIVQFIASRG